MRTLLFGALVASLAGCSHQPAPLQTAANTSNSCASTNRLACFMAVGVSLRPRSRVAASTKVERKPAISRKAQEAAVSLSTAKQGHGQM